MKPSYPEREEAINSRVHVRAMVDGRRSKAKEKRLSLMDFAEGRARILPRDEVMERLLARPKL